MLVRLRSGFVRGVVWRSRAYGWSACLTREALAPSFILPDALPSGVEVIAVQPPGRQDRLNEAPLVRVAPYADRVAEALGTLPPAPTALFGHSFGGCVAFEVARRLHDAKVKLVALVASGCRAPPLIETIEPIAMLSETAFLEAIHRRYRTSRELLQNPDLLALMLPPLRADIEALETYTYAPAPDWSLPITVLRGTKDAHVPAESDRAWAETRGPVVVREIDAGHFFIDTNREWVLAEVARALS